MEIYNEIPFFDKDAGQRPAVKPYLLEGKNNPCIITCPGGAYCCLAEHEEYYELFNKMGLSVFVLNYRVYPYHYPCQILDVQRAIKFVKYHAEEFGIDPERILIAGSSAGGHLAASACCYVDEGVDDGDEIDKLSSSVAGGILCYPVISLCEYTNGGTRNVFADGDTEIEDKFSIQKHVHSGMPPLFVWHTVTDELVDIRNVGMLAAACHDNNVPIEVHIFPEGVHGMGTADHEPYIARWASMVKEWLKHYNFI